MNIYVESEGKIYQGLPRQSYSCDLCDGKGKGTELCKYFHENTIEREEHEPDLLCNYLGVYWKELKCHS